MAQTYPLDIARIIERRWQSVHVVRPVVVDESRLRSEALHVLVRDNDIDQALRVLKKKIQREGVFREMKRRRVLREALRKSDPAKG